VLNLFALKSVMKILISSSNRPSSHNNKRVLSDPFTNVRPITSKRWSTMNYSYNMVIDFIMQKLDTKCTQTADRVNARN